MSSHPAKPLRAAIETALRNAGVASLAQIYNPEIETKAPLPYVQIAELQVIGEDDPCIDGSETFATVNVWARSRDTCDDIATAIRTALRPDLAITGHDVIVQDFQDASDTTDPDGSSRSRMTFHFQTTPV